MRVFHGRRFEHLLSRATLAEQSRCVEVRAVHAVDAGRTTWLQGAGLRQDGFDGGRHASSLSQHAPVPTQLWAIPHGAVRFVSRIPPFPNHEGCWPCTMGQRVGNLVSVSDVIWV